MTKLIEFLERMGSDARLRGENGEEVGRTMAMAGIDASTRQVILSEDQDGLEALLGASANVFAALHAPDDAPDEGETPPPPAEPGSQRSGTRKKRGGKKKGSKKKKPSPKKKAPARKKVSKKKTGKKKSGKKKTSRKKK